MYLVKVPCSSFTSYLFLEADPAGQGCPYEATGGVDFDDDYSTLGVLTPNPVLGYSSDTRYGLFPSAPYCRLAGWRDAGGVGTRFQDWNAYLGSDRARRDRLGLQTNPETSKSS